MTTGDHSIGKAITNDFDRQLFSSGQVALGIYGRLLHVSFLPGMEKASC